MLEGRPRQVSVSEADAENRVEGQFNETFDESSNESVNRNQSRGDPEKAQSNGLQLTASRIPLSGKQNEKSGDDSPAKGKRAFIAFASC